MGRCIMCGKEVQFSYGTPDLYGIYCQNCWEEFNRDSVGKILNEKDHELAVMKKALELAVSKVNWCPAKQGECSCSEHKRDCSTYFINQAKEMLKDE